MIDRRWIIWGELCMGDTTVGYVRHNNTTNKWTLDAAAWKATCKAISEAGANAVRILPYGVWDARPNKRRSQFCPYQLDLVTNLWNFGKWNIDYFPIMRKAFEIANAAGLTVWFPWFDNCQLVTGYWTKYSPWKNNLHGFTSFYDKRADGYCKNWIRKCIQKFGHLDMFWPWGNELANGKNAIDWVGRVIFPMIEELHIPYDRMTYGFTMDEAAYLGDGKFADKFTAQDTARKEFGVTFPPEANKFKVIREVHKCGTLPLDDDCPYGHRPAQAAFWWGNKPVGPFILSDDGVHEWPTSTDGGRPDAAHLKSMAAWAFKYKNCIGIEHIPEGGSVAYQANVFRAISESYRGRHGKWPINYKKE